MADIRINQLQFPDPIREQIPLTVPKTLNEIGDVFAAQKRREAIGQVLQGSPDLETAGRRLGELGLLEEARPLFALAQQKAALAQSAGQHAATLAEQKRFHDLSIGLEEKKLQQAAEEAAPLPWGGGLYRKKSGEVLLAPSGSGLFDDETMDKMARQYIAGDRSVLTNIGRGAQGGENLAKLRTAIERQSIAQGLSPEERAMRIAEFEGVKSGQRALGTRSAGLELAATEFEQMAPIALEVSKAFNRTNYPTLNALYSSYLTQTGDPSAIKLGGALLSLENIYARAVNPTGVPTDASRQEARKIFDRAYSEGQIESAIGIMSREIGAMQASPDKVRNAMRERFLRGTQAPTEEKTEAPAGMSREVANQKINSVRSTMQQRISAGGDPQTELNLANEALRRAGLPPLAGP